jgi:hypothetical protein
VPSGCHAFGKKKATGLAVKNFGLTDRLPNVGLRSRLDQEAESRGRREFDQVNQASGVLKLMVEYPGQWTAN